MESVKDLLQRVADCDLSMAELSIQCCSIKQNENCFVKGTNCQSWNEAVSQFSSFTSETILDTFKGFNFNSPKLPDEFMSYCERAINSKSGRLSKKGISELDNCAIFEYHNCMCI